MKIKKTYAFAILSAIILTVIIVTATIVLYNFYPNHSIITILALAIIVFVSSFLVVQIRAERFIYKRIKKLYEDVSILDVEEISQNNITTDLESLSETVQKFVEGKTIEIKNLTERDSFRRDFLGNVAHELKTPLFTVQGYILTLLEGAIEDKQIRKKYLERASKGVERLTSIVKDLDMIAKLETEGMKMNIQVFNILELIQNIFDLFEMRAKKRNITLRFDRIYEFPVFVKGDIERIEQVLINLIVNSIKYGKINGTTTIAIDSYSDKKFIIKVIDDGEGIKQEHIARLFERFYRVDQSRSREQGGSGLGLSIVKHIIEAHNQTILLKSVYGKGSEFAFTLEKPK